MLKLKTIIAGTFVCAALASVAAPSAQAGPLYNWLWQHHYNKLMRCAPRSFNAAAQPTCGQPAGCCTTTCTQTCQRVVVNYVPCTAFRTSWEQVPVTQFQQTSSTDPCTGCQVTCMKPCTSYSWQMRRVPYTTFRPVYRTETYSVPITVATMPPSPCSTCGGGSPCGSCSSCGTCPTAAALPQTGGCATCGQSALSPGMIGMPAVVPSTSLSNNGFTIAPGTFDAANVLQTAPPQATNPILQNNSTLAPADQVPALGKPIIIDRREITPDSSSFQVPTLTPTNTGMQGVRPMQDPNPGLRWDNRAPTTSVDDQTAAAPTRQRWDYSPVRLASYTHQVDVAAEPRSYRGELRIEAQADQVNAAWKNLD